MPRRPTKASLVATLRNEELRDAKGILTFRSKDSIASIVRQVLLGLWVVVWSSEAGLKGEVLAFRVWDLRLGVWEGFGLLSYQVHERGLMTRKRGAHPTLPLHIPP